MASLKICLIFLAPVLSAILGYLFINDRLFPEVDLKSEVEAKHAEKKWFGPGQRPKNMDESIKPFKFQVSDSELKALKARLAEDFDRLTPAVEGAAFW